MRDKLRKSLKKIPQASKSYWIVRMLLKRILGIRTPKLTKKFESKEHVIKIPPFNKEIARAIMEIAPHYYFRPNEKSREIWETDQNATCWSEYKTMFPYLIRIVNPKKVLELGAGFGRSAVFFKKKLDWQNTEIHLYEGEGAKAKYPMLGEKRQNSFCSNISVLKHILDYNNITNYQIIKPRTVDFRLSRLSGPYDIIYSFYAIGFHWTLEHYFDDIIKLMHEKTLAFFTIPDEFVKYKKLEKINFKIIQHEVAWPTNRVLRMLLMSRDRGTIESQQQSTD